ncbi:hypothetical protein SAMN04488513_101604 [Pseudozobellia thermophila]|uniref:Uncharacterized protein n=1 Tax=Pseudozobellia thermophila TaxID=192903 RepID=A0A1M6C150_9FLAO|nr:hypothetical protein SAMN04488513_101604 [Pseudozobellia thermophila]
MPQILILEGNSLLITKNKPTNKKHVYGLSPALNFDGADYTKKDTIYTKRPDV